MVSALGLGGFHIGKIPTEREAIRLVHAAIEGGITFLDNAWEYHDGKSETRMGKAIKDRRGRVFLMTKVCTHGRDAKTAMRQLEQSLRRLQTEYLDLWQIHECAYYNDPEQHFAKGGVVEALERARKQGKVRYVGFTGHKDPEIHLEMLSYEYPFDSCQLPLNGFDATFRSFEQRVLPELKRQEIARARDEEPGSGHGGHEESGHAGRRASLRDEPAGGDDHQRDRFDARPVAEPQDRAGLQADDARPDGAPTAAGWRPTRPTDASSCTRPPRSTMASKGARSTASRHKKSSAADKSR